MADYNAEIQNLLNSDSDGQNIRVESNVLDPATINDRHALFKIPNSGILDIGSRITMSLYGSTENTNLTMMGGAYSIIKNATLSHQGVNIAQTIDSNYLMSIRQNWVQQETRRNRGRIVNGCNNIYEYAISGLGAGDKTGVLSYSPEHATGKSNENVADKYKLANGADAAGVTRRSEFSIELSELFPELSMDMIPVYLLDDNIVLDIEFTSNIHTGPRASAVNGTLDVADKVLIDKTDFKFVSDHLFFDEAVMASLRNQSQTDRGIVISYGDFNTVMNTMTPPTRPGAGTITSKNFRFNIGLSNLRVRYMLLHNQMANHDAVADQPYNQICGRYASVGPQGPEELQIVINNTNYFNSPITSASRLYSELTDIYAIAPYIPSSAYSCDGQVHDAVSSVQGAVTNNTVDNLSSGFTSSQFRGTAQTQLAGSNHILGINMSFSKKNTFNAGIKVGSVPVEINYTFGYSNERFQSIQQRAFICVERILALKNGGVSTNYS